MKKLIKIVLLTVSLALFANAGDINIDKELQRAVKENKQIMFFLHIPRCPYCDRMLKKNFKNKEILEEIGNNFILIDIYTATKGTVTFKDFKGTHKEFAKHIGASAYPATIFMDKEGSTVHKAIGYRNIDEHMADIKYVSTKSYKKISLETFAENLEFEKDD